MAFIGPNFINMAYNSKKKFRNPKFRYKLKISLNNNSTNKIIVIMKNPSTTCDNVGGVISNYKTKKNCHVDRSTGNILRKIKNTTNYDEIIIYNLYPIYGTTPQVVKDFYYTPNQRNGQHLLSRYNKFLRKQLSKLQGTDIICAWGRPNGIKKSDYNTQIHSVLSYIDKTTNKFLQYDLKKNKFTPLILTQYREDLQPLHGSKWK